MQNKILTTNRIEVQKWAMERNGRPAFVPNEENSHEGNLEISFPENGDDNLENISWDKFFNIFEQNNYALEAKKYEENGGLSTEYNFISR